jgi:hypothetical protein
MSHLLSKLARLVAFVLNADHAVDLNSSNYHQESAHIPAKIQYAYVTLAILCLMMGSMSIVMCSLSLKLYLSYRNESEYLNAFIQRHLSNKLFLNKYLFIKESWIGLESLSSFFTPVLGHLKSISCHVQEYGPALAMALLTTNILTAN